MRRTIPLVVAAAVTSVAAGAAVLAPAHGVSGGSDDVDHPMVGVMTAHDSAGNALWDCSGTLLSATVFLTAGHCTSDDAGMEVARVEVFFSDEAIPTDEEFLADVTSGDDPSCLVDESTQRHDGYPCSGLTGVAHTHPHYDSARFWRHDLGVVVLAEEDRVELEEYGELPDVGAFAGWRSNRKETFDAVGFGKQHDHGQGAWKPAGAVERRLAHPRLVSINKPSLGDHAMELSGDARTGGTCSGDSGGPNFLAGTLVIAAVTSYGMNAQTCSGPDGAYRLDGQDDADFLAGFGPYPAP